MQSERERKENRKKISWYFYNGQAYTEQKQQIEVKTILIGNFLGHETIGETFDYFTLHVTCEM